MLDEIANDRIFCLKQRTLPWSFRIFHLPGNTNLASDATSKYPSSVIGLLTVADQIENTINAAICVDTKETFSVSWDKRVTKTAKDQTLALLLRQVQTSLEAIQPDEIAIISEN